MGKKDCYPLHKVLNKQVKAVPLTNRASHWQGACGQSGSGNREAHLATGQRASHPETTVEVNGRGIEANLVFAS